MGRPLWAKKRATSNLVGEVEIRRTKFFQFHPFHQLPLHVPDSWATLPGEILALIFSYLPVPDIKIVSLVNRVWYSVGCSEFLWKLLHFKHFGGPRFDGRSWRFHCMFAYKEQETIKRIGFINKKPTTFSSLQDYQEHTEPTDPNKLCTIAHADGEFTKIPQYLFELWMWAADRGHYRVLQALWSSKRIPNLEIRDPISRRTALYRTVQGGHVDCLKWLISAGANPEARRDELATPLFCAAALGNLETVKVLIEANVDVNEAGRAGGTPLIMACQNRRIDVLHYLLSLPQCDINKPLRDGETPLFVASMLGFIDVIDILLQHKADVNKARYTGSTPFWIACKHGQLAVVQLLAQVDQVDKSTQVQGVSCLEIALRKGQFSVANYLIKHLRTDWQHLPPTPILLQQINRNLM